jgi:GLPGLI family protein
MPNMKYFFTLVLTIFIALTLPAQKTDTAIGKIYYTFKHMPDSTMPAVFNEEHMVLYLGKAMNAYISLDKYKRDSAMRKQFEEGGGMTINTGGKKVTNTQIFSDKADRKMIIMEKMIKNYYYDDPYPDIKWNITNEVKEIARFKCTKATGTYKGRTYHAWFTTEIPLEGAPWKLQGLPGLVLEAYDSRQQVQFLFNGMEKNINTDFVMSDQPAKAIKTTKKDYQQMREAAQNDPIGFINASASDAGTSFRVNPGENTNGNFKPRKQPNPVELTDN